MSEKPLRSRNKDRRLIGGTNSIRYNSGMSSAAASSKGKRSYDDLSVSSSSSGSLDALAKKDEMNLRRKIYEHKHGKPHPELGPYRSDDDDSGEENSSTSSPSVQILHTPRASPDNSNNNAAARAGVGASKPSRVSAPKAKKSSAIIQTIPASVQSAIETKLGAKQDKSSTSHSGPKLITHMNKLIKNRDSIVRAAANCSQLLKSRVLSDIPAKEFSTRRTNKPDVAAAMAKAWTPLYELLQHDNNQLSNQVKSDLKVFIDILEGTQRYCMGKLDREANSNAKGPKSVKLSAKQLSREHGQDGGVAIDDPCVCCGHTRCDREPEFADNARENKSRIKKWKKQKEHLKQYKDGSRNDAPVDENDKEITNLANPKMLPLIVQCQCVKNYASLVRGGRQCAYGCKVDGTQYPLGACPVCLCSCNFAHEESKRGELRRAFELQRMSKETTTSQRDEANNYLDRIGNHGGQREADTRAQLQEMQAAGSIDLTSDEMDDVARTVKYNSQAHFMTHNPVGSNGQTFFENVIQRSNHPRGPSHSIPLNSNMRRSQQASKQRAINTRLEDAQDLHGDTTGGFRQSDMDEAIRRSMGAASSNHSQGSYSRSRPMTSSDMNAVLMPQMFQGNSYPSHDPFSFGGAAAFDPNSNASNTPCNYKSEETPQKESSPDHVVICREILLDASMDAAFDEADKDAALQGAQKLQKSATDGYDQTMSNVAKVVHAQHKEKKITTPQAAAKLVDSTKRISRLG